MCARRFALGTTIRHNAAEVDERSVYLLSHPCLRLIGDRSMHRARTCSSVQQCLELHVGAGIGGWRKQVSHYSTRDFSLIKFSVGLEVESTQRIVKT